MYKCACGYTVESDMDMRAHLVICKDDKVIIHSIAAPFFSSADDSFASSDDAYDE